MNRLTGLALLSCLALTACPGSKPTAGPDAATVQPCTTLKCGTACCTQGQTCYNGGCCTPTSCANRDCGDDGCGVNCGICGTGTTCNKDTWTCDTCTPETDAAFCLRLGKECGPFTGKDNCGNDRKDIPCGTCTNGKGCATDNTCTAACVPQTVDEFCAAHGKNCGSYTGPDNCVAARTENCGTCPNGGLCTDNVCPCVYSGKTVFCNTMATAGKVCGLITDKNNCGGDQIEDCGVAACIAGTEVCDPATNTCKACTPETDTALCTANGKECGTFATTDKCGVARNPTCPVCVDTSKTCTANICKITGGPANDACDAPEVLGFTGNTATVTADTASANPDYTGSCSTGSATGKDLVYTFTITGSDPKKVTATVTKGGTGSIVPVVYIRATTCALAAAEKACGAGTTMIGSAAPGTYYVFVDSSTAAGGEFTLTVTLDTALVPPANDLCANAVYLGDVSNTSKWTHDGTANTDKTSIDGTTTGANNDVGPGTCATAAAPHNGGDVAYKLTIPAGADRSVDVKVTAAATATGYNPAVYVRSVCDSADPTKEIGCANLASGAAEVVVNKLAAGDYWIIVNGANSQGDFTLEVTLGVLRIVPDDCSTPTVLPLVSGHGSITGDTTLSTKMISTPSCGSSVGKQLVYVVDTTNLGPHSVVAKVTFTDPLGSSKVFVRQVCTSALPADELGCAYSDYSNVSTASVNLVPEGPFYVFVGEVAGEEGAFTLDVTLGAPVYIPDTCAGAIALTGFDPVTGNGSVTVPGDTTTAKNDTTGTCKLTSTGKDVVYFFDVPTGVTKDMKATLTFTGYDYPLLYVRKTACDASTSTDEIGCTGSSTNTPAIVRSQGLTAGRYWVWADGSSSSDYGPFILNVTLEDPQGIPTNDTCGTNGASATLLTFNTSGVSSVTGNTDYAKNDYTGSCDTMTGYDVAYSFVIPAGETHSVIAKVTGTGGLAPGVYIRSVCDSSTTANELACASGTSTATAKILSLGAGTYYVIVDGVDATSGAYTLDVTLGNPLILPDNCAVAQPLAGFDVNGNGTVTVDDDTSGATDDGYGSCKTTSGTTSGKDLVYSFDVPAGKVKNVSAKMTFGLSGDWPMVYIRKVCGSPAAADEVACAAVSTSTPATAKANGLAAGTYYIWADASYSIDYGPFTLDVTLSDPGLPPANDTCGTGGANAVPLIMTAGVGTVTDTTDSALNDYTGGCAAMTGGDMVYSFVVPAGSPASVTAKVVPDSSYAPGVYIRTVCGSALDEVSCASANAGATATATVGSLNPGTYYVVVDGKGGSSGGFTLTVTLGTPNTLNDGCWDAQALTGFDAITGNGTAHATGDTTSATNSTDGTCVNTSQTGAKDLVYYFDVPAGMTKDVTASMDFAASSTYAMVYIRKACSSSLASDELACNAQSGSLAAVASAMHLTAGRYWVWADANYTTDAGSFTLDVTLTDSQPAPLNDNCAGSEPLFLTGDVDSVNGDTSHAVNDYTGTCTAANGGDVVYALTIPSGANRSITATVTPSAGYTPAVYIRTVCDSPTAGDQRACAYATTAGSPTSATVSNAPPGVYYIVVDGTGGTKGTFALDVSLGTAFVVPDDCTSPGTLSFSAGGVATVSGDTTTATDSGSSYSCGGTGPDVVYQLDLAAIKDVQINVVPKTGSALQAVVSLRTTCATSSTEVKCFQATAAGATAALSFAHLAAGTYFIWVDGYSGTKGAFDLTVTLTNPAATPANDTCGTNGANATPLSFTAGVASVTDTTLAATNDYTGTCATMTGGDMVYSFAIPTGQSNSVTAKVTPTGTGYSPAVYIRTVCDVAGTPNQLACASSTTGAATASLLSLGVGTYYVIVDGVSASSGGFTLDVTLGAPIVLPDDCTTAQALTGFDVVTGNGTVTVTGDTTVANSTTTGTCKTTVGKDLVYYFDVPTVMTKAVTAKLTFSASGMWPMVYIRSVCGSTSITDEMACASTSSNVPAIAVAKRLPAGRYWVWVDASYDTDTSPFTLDVTLSDPLPAPANDSCAGTITDLVFAGAVATATPDTTSATNDATGSCAAANGSDLVYRFTIPAAGGPQSVSAVLTRDAAATTLTPVVYIRKSCDDPQHLDELACAKAATNVATATVNSLSPGDYYVWVDGIGDGKSTLTVTLAAPIAGGPADYACTFATPITITGPTTTVPGSTTGGVNNTKGSCNGSYSPEAVYSLTTTVDKKLTVKVTPTATSTFRPTVYVRKSCDSGVALDELACAYASTTATAATVTVNNLLAGTYYIWVDGYGYTTPGYPGDFTMDVTLDTAIPPPTNDTCSAPIDIPISPSTLTGSVVGATTAAVNDTQGSCSGSTGIDVVYKFTTTAAQKLTATVTPDGSSTTFYPVIYVRTVCASTLSTDEKGCAYSSTAGAAKALVINNLPAGTYYAWVDGYSSSFGGFTLDLKLEAPVLPPANDVCGTGGASAVPLSLGVSVNGDTSLAAPNYTGTLSATCSSDSYPGPDLVYSYKATSTASFTVTVTPAASFDPALWIGSGTCGDLTSCLDSIDYGGSGTAETLTITTPVIGTTYYFYVTSWTVTYASGKGTFSIVVN